MTHREVPDPGRARPRASGPVKGRISPPGELAEARRLYVRDLGHHLVEVVCPECGGRAESVFTEPFDHVDGVGVSTTFLPCGDTVVRPGSDVPGSDVPGPEAPGPDGR